MTAALDIRLDPGPAIEGARKVRRVLDDVTNAAATTEKAVEKTADAVASVGKGGADGRKVVRTFQDIENAAANTNRSIGRIGSSANDNFSRMAREAGVASGSVGRLTGVVDQMKTSVLAASAAAGTAARSFTGMIAALGIGAGGASVIRTASEFQSLEASLKTVTGSAANAQRALTFIQQFAAETPFSLQEVTEAFIRLQSLGLDPSRDALESYGNTASAMGKPIMQFIEAVADAVTGENERLKEFGIRAKVDGEKVAYTFQGVTTTIGNNTREIEGYLRNLGKTRFGGAMAEQALILPGVLSNLGDSISTFQNEIGKGGLADAVKEAAAETATFLNTNKELAGTIGAFAGGALSDFRNDVSGIVKEVTEAWRWLKATGEVVSALTPTFQGADQQIASVGSTMATVAEGFSTAWNASGRVMYTTINGVIGVSVGAFNAVEATWDALPSVFSGLAKRAGNALVDGLQTAVNGSIAGVNSLIAAVNSVAPEFAKIPEFKPVDLSAYKASLTEAETATAQTITSIMSAAMSTDYLGKGMDALSQPVAEAGKQIAAAKQRIDEAANSTKTLSDTAKLTGEGFQIVPPGTADAIDKGVTKPSKEAAKALREAAAAKKALFSEADQAIAEFFPMEAAQKEADRLNALINDSTNGLSDLQRQALGLKIDKGFRDAQAQANGLVGGVNSVNDALGQTGSLVESLSDVFADVFSQATRDGESFFDSVLRGAAAAEGSIDNSTTLLERIAA